LKDVVIAPHLAWLILETLQRNFENAMRNMMKVRAGLPQESRVA